MSTTFAYDMRAWEVSPPTRIRYYRLPISASGNPSPSLSHLFLYALGWPGMVLFSLDQKPHHLLLVSTVLKPVADCPVMSLISARMVEGRRGDLQAEIAMHAVKTLGGVH